MIEMMMGTEAVVAPQSPGSEKETTPTRIGVNFMHVGRHHGQGEELVGIGQPLYAGASLHHQGLLPRRRADTTRRREGVYYRLQSPSLQSLSFPGPGGASPQNEPHDDMSG